MQRATPPLLWVAGPWSACVAACGDSLAVRVLTCPPCLSFDLCKASGPRPSDTTSCTDNSQCSSHAGLGEDEYLLFGMLLLIAGGVPIGTLACCLIVLLVSGSLGKGRRSARICKTLSKDGPKTMQAIVPQASDPQPTHPTLPKVAEGSDRTCHCGHPLETSTAPRSGDNFCNSCSQEVHEGIHFWFCRQCRLEVCDACCDAVLATPRRLCRQRHELICCVVSWNSLTRCAECRQSALPGEAVWNCAQCRYDACDRCCRRLCGERPVSQCPEGHDLTCMADGPPRYNGRARCQACALPNLGGAGRPLYFHCAICRYDLCQDCAAASGLSCAEEAEEDDNSGETMMPLHNCHILHGFAPRMTSREEAAMRIIDEVTSERARILQQVHGVPRWEKTTLVTKAEQLNLEPEYIGAQRMLRNHFSPAECIE